MTMIRINLLPERYRKAERTSPKVFAAVLVAVILVCCSFGWFGYVYFGELGRLEIQHRELKERLAGLQDLVKHHDALVQEKSDFEQRSKTIEQINKSRVLWTKVLDELVDVVNNNGDTERHTAWFRNVTVKDGSKKVGPEVSMPGWVQGGDVRRVANFHEDFEHSDFFRYVKEKSLPSGDINVDPKKSPAESLFFQLKWRFEPTRKWDKIDEAYAAAEKASKGSD